MKGDDKMSERYKVWVEVEAVFDEGTKDERYDKIDLPFGTSASFDTAEQAECFAKWLHAQADKGALLMKALSEIENGHTADATEALRGLLEGETQKGAAE